MAANPTIPLSKVAPGEKFTIPCKPEQNCCPLYLYAAPNGTGKPLLPKVWSVKNECLLINVTV